MTTAATSPLRAPIEGGAWARYLAFLARPALPDRATGVGIEGVVTVIKLLALDLLIMAGLVGVFALAGRLGFTPPKSLLDGIKPSALILAFIAVGAPLGEELLFRSWQSGRPGHVGAWLIALGAVGLGVLLLAGVGTHAAAIAGLGILIAGMLAAAAWLWLKRGRPPIAGFARRFAWFYYGAAFVFAAVHMSNFSGGVTLALLPLTLPQFSVGLMLGYVRVNHGLWASVMLHALHNSLFVGIMLLGTR